MENKVFNNGKIMFEYSDKWLLEFPDTNNNPDCLVTLSLGENNLLNLVEFPSQTNLEDFKIVVEDIIESDGGRILSSEITKINNYSAIKVIANIVIPEITFDIHTFIFIENQELFIFELRSVNSENEIIEDYLNIIKSFKILI